MTDGRRTPDGSPKGNSHRRRRSSGFLYPTALSSTQTVYYDGEQLLVKDFPVKSASDESKVVDIERRSYHDVDWTEVIEMKDRELKGSLEELEIANIELYAKNRELDDLRHELASLKIEAARRTMQARSFRESETNSKVARKALQEELDALQEENASLKKVQKESIQTIKQLEDKLRQSRDDSDSETIVLKKNVREAHARLQASLRELEASKLRNTELESKLERESKEVSSLRVRLKDTESKLEEIQRMRKEDGLTAKTLQAEVKAERTRAESLEKVVEVQLKALQPPRQSYPSPSHRQLPLYAPKIIFDELLVQVALPNGQQSEFLIRYDRDNPKQSAEDFAAKHNLSLPATRHLISFVLAESQSRYST
jgi:myosin heavy subunit